MADKKIQFEQPSGLLIFFNRFWIIITAILIGSLLLSGYYFVIKPKMDSNDVLRDNALQVAVDRKKSEQLLKNLENLETTYKDIKNNRQADLDRLKEIVPSNPQIAELFVLSDKLAKQHNFQLQDISISSISEKTDTSVQNVATDEDGEPTNAVATSTTKAKDVVFLKVLKIDFKLTPIVRKDELTIEEANGAIVTNYYQSFKVFLDALEKNLRLTDIQSVNFSALQEDYLKVPTFQFSVQTYYR